MRPLVAVRQAAPFDRSVLTDNPLFWPLARAIGAVSGHEDFPPIDALGRVFEGPPPVRFVLASPRRRRNRRGANTPVDTAALYDARITEKGEVPTRPRCWHDLMNALVWGTFPSAKRALHARQHRAVCSRISPGDTSLPPFRTRELDALAILDEGGVAVLARDPEPLRETLKMTHGASLREGLSTGAAIAVIFGHALYESLALGVPPAVVAAIVLECGGFEPHGVVPNADRALASVLNDARRLRTPDELARIDLADLLPD